MGVALLLCDMPIIWSAEKHEPPALTLGALAGRIHCHDLATRTSHRFNQSYCSHSSFPYLISPATPHFGVNMEARCAAVSLALSWNEACGGLKIDAKVLGKRDGWRSPPVRGTLESCRAAALNPARLRQSAREPIRLLPCSQTKPDRRSES